MKRNFSAFHIVVFLISLSVTGLISGCGSETKSAATSQTSKPQSANQADVTTGGKSCLLEYTEKLTDLLTENMIRKHIPGMPVDVELYAGTKTLKMSSYTWPSTRKASREIAGQVIEYNIANEVTLKWLRPIKGDDPLARFKRMYRTLTPEEEKKIAAEFNKAMDEQAEAKKLTEDGTKMGKDLAAGLMKGLRFENVHGVGTAAAWGGTAGQYGLRVLDRDTEFELVVNVSADEARNRELSIALAKDILDMCN
jgi:hypothetical protein